MDHNYEGASCSSCVPDDCYARNLKLNSPCKVVLLHHHVIFSLTSSQDEHLSADKGPHYTQSIQYTHMTLNNAGYNTNSGICYHYASWSPRATLATTPYY